MTNLLSKTLLLLQDGVRMMSVGSSRANCQANATIVKNHSKLTASSSRKQCIEKQFQ